MKIRGVSEILENDEETTRGPDSPTYGFRPGSRHYLCPCVSPHPVYILTMFFPLSTPGPELIKDLQINPLKDIRPGGAGKKKEGPGRAKKGNGTDFPFPLPLQGPYGLKQELNYNTATLASNYLYIGTLTQIFIFFKYGKSRLPYQRPPAA